MQIEGYYKWCVEDYFHRVILWALARPRQISPDGVYGEVIAKISVQEWESLYNEFRPLKSWAKTMEKYPVLPAQIWHRLDIYINEAS